MNKLPSARNRCACWTLGPYQDFCTAENLVYNKHYAGWEGETVRVCGVYVPGGYVERSTHSTHLDKQQFMCTDYSDAKVCSSIAVNGKQSALGVRSVCRNTWRFKAWRIGTKSDTEGWSA
jgi:hypothetical protein